MVYINNVLNNTASRLLSEVDSNGPMCTWKNNCNHEVQDVLYKKM